MEKTLNNLEETEQLANELAGKLHPGQVVAFYGDLGTGKTTLIQFIAKKLGINQPVTSPTFVIQKNYPICHPELDSGSQIVHIDCYRLSSVDDAKDLGFEELFADQRSLIFVEWAEKIEELLPKNAVRIRLSTIDENRRKVEIND
jgi:tRNA threonylcarbamoyladenosine biosynthesis protein TsaE